MWSKPPELYLNDPNDRSASEFAVFGYFGVKHRDAVRVGRERIRSLETRLEAARRLAEVGPDEYHRLVDDGATRYDAKLLEQVLAADRSDLELLCKALRLDPVALGERAAIYEFDGGFVRREAERRALADMVRASQRLRPFLEMAESGELLDLAYEIYDIFGVGTIDSQAGLSGLGLRGSV